LGDRAGEIVHALEEARRTYRFASRAVEGKMKSPVLAAVVQVLLLAPVVSVVAAELSPEDVQRAMHKGVAYLKDRWQTDKGWTDYTGQEGGITCLCTLALLNAGEPLDDEHSYLKKALEKVRHLRSTKTYVVALQTMVLCRAGQPDSDQALIARNVDWLQRQQIKENVADDRKGGWSYGENVPGPQGSTQGDGSNSQFALLALYEAARATEKHHLHIKIDRETWEHARVYWIRNRRGNGGWGYYQGLDPTGSMTCAGISSLVICSDMLHEPDAKVSGDRIDGWPRAFSADREYINSGVEWLRRNFTVKANPHQAGGNGLWHYYFLYGLERAGRLSARRKIGEHDWYREGADHLVGTINAALQESFWRGSGFAETDPDITTSLALLFLSKGRWPALMAKVQFGRPERSSIREADKHWNWHRNDVNNLTINTEAHWKFEMTWQEIDINKANVDELLEVPVLFFSGNGNPLPDGDEQRKRLADNLRDYIDRGGFIFADGGEVCPDGKQDAAEFDKGFRQLMDLVFQKPEYQFKKLDQSHPVWSADEQIKDDQVRLLLGINYGCRTSVIYAPADPDHPRPTLATLWDLSRSSQRESYSKSVQDQIKGGLAIGRNVLTYATNRELKGREYSFQNNVAKIIPDRERGKFAIAKLQHLGGCDDAPRALANLMEQAATDLHIRVEAHPKIIPINNPVLFDYPVVFMHGRNAFRLTDAERQALREYVERGGVLFADAICGSEPFAESFRNEMSVIFPKNSLMSIPANDPIWTTKYGGYDLSLVTRRDPQPTAVGEGRKSTLRRVPPEFKAVRIGDRYGVIFSEFDLSCALEKHDSLECRGYTREDAARIGINVLRYAMQQ
jgi:hypothetical protein